MKSTLAESVKRLRIADRYGTDWENLLCDPDTDPQMARDVVAVLRAHLKIVPVLQLARDVLIELQDDNDDSGVTAARLALTDALAWIEENEGR